MLLFLLLMLLILSGGVGYTNYGLTGCGIGVGTILIAIMIVYLCGGLSI